MASQQQTFLTQGNYQKIVEFLRNHYATRMNLSAIPERMNTRIQSTVQHYMKEVAKMNAASVPATALNHEVLRESTNSIDMWMRRQEPATVPTRSVQTVPSVASASASTAAARMNSRVTAIKTSAAPATVSRAAAFDEVNSLFDAAPMQPSAKNILSPEFQYANVDEEEDPIVLMERIKKQRDAEYSTSVQPASPPKMEVLDPTPQVQPAPVRTTPLPQDYIIPQEDVVKYREMEYNIFLTSSDRDWMRNKGENRYNFSVNFNPGNRTGFGLSPSVQERFRNIVRLEFVKALLPTESLTTLVRTTAISPSVVTNADRVVNIFSLPFVGVRIAEVNANGFSTNPREDNTFALLQYDSTWNSDISQNTANPSKNRVGYTGFIPKFLKCQRVYEPTPLTTLQKLTIRMERHDGVVLSEDPDVMNVVRVCLSSATTGIALTNSSVYAQTGNEYIFVQSSVYFPFSAFAEGDLVNIQGYAAAASGPGTPATGTLLDFNDAVNSEAGHRVVAIAHVDPATGAIIDGANPVGYANIIILRSRFVDPTTGSTARSFYGGSNIEESQLELRINGQPSVASTCGMINLSRQTHLVLRVITREVDSSTNIRPDNV
jgi:hypothetical protein